MCRPVNGNVSRMAGRMPIGRLLVLLSSGAAIVWGTRVVILEGFVYEWPRHFKGDFYNAMFGAWNGQGIYYGPVFVMERWLVDLAPRVFNEYFFAVLDVPLLVLAFLFAVRAARLDWEPTVLVGALWVCFHWVPYAFSVAANPEIVELALLCVAWWAASRRNSVGLAATAAAALTKRIPALFIPLLIMTEPTKRSLLVGVLVTALIVTLVGVVQHLGPVEMLRQTLNPASVSLAQIAPGGVHEVAAGNVTNILAQPFTYPTQFLSLSNALARLFDRPTNDWTLSFFQGFYYVVAAGVVIYATYLAYALLDGRHRVPRPQSELLAFGFFFAVIPLASITTHPHTFIFLLPTWTAIVALVQLESVAWRKGGLAVLGALCYLFTGFPAAAALADRLLHTHLWISPAFQDPIWANLVLLLVLFAYGSLLLHDRAVAVGVEPALSEPARRTRAAVGQERAGTASM
jgi:hypothetical protein